MARPTRFFETDGSKDGMMDWNGGLDTNFHKKMCKGHLLKTRNDWILWIRSHTHTHTQKLRTTQWNPVEMKLTRRPHMNIFMSFSLQKKRKEKTVKKE